MLKKPVLWNRNYLFRGSDFWKVLVPVPVPTFEKLVPVPVPTFEKVTVPVPVPAPYLDHKKQIFKKKIWTFLDFLHSKLFYKEKVHKFQQIYGKMWMKKMFKEGNQIHNFLSSSGSGTLINYGSGSDFLTNYGSGSGSTSQKVPVPPVPVP